VIDILALWNNVWPYLVAILLFLTLIIIHEFGHFISAKLLGVRVNEFAVGFGPKIFSKQGKETKYSLNLIPLGGYCAMEGEDENSADEKAFCNKAAWRRFLIVVMGAVFNLILGLIIVAIILAPTKMFATTTIAEFSETAVSAKSGLMANDTILEVDGRRIFTTYDLSYAFTNVKDGKVDIVVNRDGEKVELKSVLIDISSLPICVKSMIEITQILIRKKIKFAYLLFLLFCLATACSASSMFLRKFLGFGYK
jgi:regulator of sigma E protease